MSNDTVKSIPILKGVGASDFYRGGNWGMGKWGLKKVFSDAQLLYNSYKYIKLQLYCEFPAFPGGTQIISK